MANPFSVGHTALSRKKRLEEERFHWTGNEYLDRFHIEVYLTDLINMLLQRRDNEPLEVAANYFKSILNGNNILLRGFDYINSTHLNRWSFCMQIRRAYLSATVERSFDDWEQLIFLFCRDFPRDQIKHSFAIAGQSEFLEVVSPIFADKDSDENRMSKISCSDCIARLAGIITSQQQKISCPLISSVMASVSNYRRERARTGSDDDLISFEEFIRQLGKQNCLGFQSSLTT